MANSITRVTVGAPMMMTPDEDRQAAVKRAVDEAVTVPTEFVFLKARFDSVISAFSPELEKIQEKVDLCEAIEAVFQVRMEPLSSTENEYHTRTWEEFRRWKWIKIRDAFSAGFWEWDPLREDVSVAVQTFRWLLENNHGYDPTFGVGSFQNILRVPYQRDVFLYINQVLALDLPDIELRGYVRTILTESFEALTPPPCKPEEVREILRLQGQLDHSMLRYLREYCKTVCLPCKLVTEDWANLNDDDIEMIVELGQFMGYSLSSFICRVILCMSHDMSWNLKLWRAIDGFTWAFHMGLERPYKSIIATFVERFQEQKEVNGSSLKESMIQMLQHISAATIQKRDATLCYAIHVLTSKSIFTLDELREVLGEVSIAEFQENGVEQMNLFERIVRRQGGESSPKPSRKPKKTSRLR